VYKKIIDDARNDLKTLLNVPDNYKILFLQGGASTQFSAVPLHLMKKKAAYINTGHWSNRAINDAKMYGDVKVVASSEDELFTYIPNCSNLDIDDCDYLYYCDNNTIYGTKFKEVPNSKNKILVCDMSSSILSERIDVSKYGIIFAGAQKNVGPAGVTIVIIREDLIEECNPLTPTMLRYKKHSDAESLFNTPPTYAIYICSLVFKDLIEHGGIEEIEKKNKFKAEYLYDYLDSSKLYTTRANKKDRSYMNVVFSTGSKELDLEFVEKAKERGLVNLKGHKVIGGLRASIYNAMEIDGVIELVNFMKEFEEKHV
jgi:phosphoserine aminotransferase